MVKSNLPNSTFQNCKSANLEENSLERGKEEKVPNVSTTLNKFAIFAQHCKGKKITMLQNESRDNQVKLLKSK